MRNYFEEFKQRLVIEVSNPDTESAHTNADCILKEVALNTTLTKSQRTRLVRIYEKVSKWYA